MLAPSQKTGRHRLVTNCREWVFCCFVILLFLFGNSPKYVNTDLYSKTVIYYLFLFCFVLPQEGKKHKSIKNRFREKQEEIKKKTYGMNAQMVFSRPTHSLGCSEVGTTYSFPTLVPSFSCAQLII